MTGTVQVNDRDEENPVAELIVEEIQSLREVREKRVKRLELRLHVDMATDDKLARAGRARQEVRRAPRPSRWRC